MSHNKCVALIIVRSHTAQPMCYPDYHNESYRTTNVLPWSSQWVILHNISITMRHLHVILWYPSHRSIQHLTSPSHRSIPLSSSQCCTSRHDTHHIEPFNTAQAYHIDIFHFAHLNVARHVMRSHQTIQYLTSHHNESHRALAFCFNSLCINSEAIEALVVWHIWIHTCPVRLFFFF